MGRKPWVRLVTKWKGEERTYLVIVLVLCGDETVEESEVSATRGFRPSPILNLVDSFQILRHLALHAIYILQKYFRNGD